MRWSTRFVVCAAIVGVPGLVLLKNKVQDIWDQYNVGPYIQSSWKNGAGYDTADKYTSGGQPGDKIIIMAKLEKENADWVTESLPDWQAAIYTVNPSANRTADLTTPVNKGHEGMAYLSYIIDNYDRLPSTLAFIHSHRDGFLKAWHTDTPLHDNVDALRKLQIPFVQSNGYVNLRCKWNPGCLESHRKNQHVTPTLWLEVFGGTSTDKLEFPVKVGTGCCAQFAVSKAQVLSRPLDDYQHIRDWLVKTEESDRKSGRVMEFLWHVIFGKEGV